MPISLRVNCKVSLPLTGVIVTLSKMQFPKKTRYLMQDIAKRTTLHCRIVC